MYTILFAKESRDTLKALTLFIIVKAMAKLNLEHRNKFEIEFLIISRRSSRSSDNAELFISRCYFAEDRTAKKCAELQRTCTAIFLLIKSFV